MIGMMVFVALIATIGLMYWRRRASHLAALLKNEMEAASVRGDELTALRQKLKNEQKQYREWHLDFMAQRLRERRQQPTDQAIEAKDREIMSLRREIMGLTARVDGEPGSDYRRVVKPIEDQYALRRMRTVSRETLLRSFIAGDGLVNGEHFHLI